MVLATNASRRGPMAALIALTTCLAAAAITVATYRILTGMVLMPPVFDLVSTTVVLGLAAFLVAPLRIGSAMYPQSLVDIAIMLGLMMLPSSWLIVVTFSAIVVGKSLARQRPWQILFVAAKDVVVVVAATAVGVLLGLPMPFTPTSAALPGLIAMAATMICVDELLGAPVEAMSKGRRIRDGLLVRLFTAMLRLAFAILAGWLLRHNARIAIAVPMLALGLYLRYANQWERRADQLAWRRLSNVVDALGTNDDATVRRAAVLGAVELFGCEEVDLVLNAPEGGPMLLRGAGGAITYEGPEAGAPPANGHVIVLDLDRRDPQDLDVTTVRLRTARGSRGRSAARDGEPAKDRVRGRARVAVPVAATNRAAASKGTSGSNGVAASTGATGGNGAAPSNGATGGNGAAAGNGATGGNGAAAGNGAGANRAVEFGEAANGVLGELRLRFRTPTQLTEREEYTLRALAAALGTAVRKSNAVAEAARIVMAGTHAFTHDPLTGLANRRHLLDYDALPDNGLAALAVIDLTGLKDIVSGLGQAVGDHVVTTVANQLAARVDAGDLVAKLSRSEFAVLYPRVAAASTALERTKRLVAAVSEPLRVDEVRLTAGPVAGLAVAGDGTVEELLRRADVALSQAKRSNQSIMIYVPTWDTADVEQLALFADLPRAVADREFTAVFQPVVDLGTGVMIGAEALARWPHPQLGKLPPARFLAGMERSGLLSAFTELMLDRALAGARTWREAGFAVPVAVNVSPRSLLDPDFPARIPAALERYGLPPDALVLEVTETFTLAQLDVVDDALHRLQRMGITLALDDFGTGYSSLAMVARVPVHELKIDRSFVTGLAGSIENAIVRSTIELGRTLELLVVAEGVETEEQRRRLFDYGCPAGQGHLFGRPVDIGELVERLETGTDGVPGTLITPLHQDGTVIRLPSPRPAAEQRLHDERS